MAATSHRRHETAQLRLVGATPSQVLWTVGLETLVLVATGVAFGSIASLVTIVPHSVARSEVVAPGTGIAVWLGVATAATMLALASALGAARRAVRHRPAPCLRLVKRGPRSRAALRRRTELDLLSPLGSSLRGMRVLAACSLGGAGHLQPLLPFLDAARHRGHETLVVGPPALQPLVDSSGHPFVAGDEPPEEAIAPIRDQLPALPAREASVLANRELFGRLATTAMLPTTEHVLARWHPDVVLRDPCEYASAAIAPRHGVPTAQIAIGLAEVEWESIAVAAPALEAHRSGLADELRRSPYLTRLPAAVDPSPFPDTRRFRDPPAVAAQALPDWWHGSRAPLIYMTFGTVFSHMSMAAETYRTAAQALAGIDARVLFTVGHGIDLSQLGSLPGHVHAEPWVDQAQVLAEAELVVCHGGSGTTFGALAAGVPVVILPLFADQLANGLKVAEAGAGILLDTGQDNDGPRRTPNHQDGRSIAAAVDTIRADSSYRDQARSIAAEMALAPTAAALLDDLMAP